MTDRPAPEAAFRPDELEWEEPPSNGRPSSEDRDRLIEQVNAMIPALRSRVGSWAVLEAWASDPREAGRWSGRLNKVFMEQGVQLRAAKIKGTDASKLYVRVRPLSWREARAAVDAQ